MNLISKLCLALVSPLVLALCLPALYAAAAETAPSFPADASSAAYEGKWQEAAALLSVANANNAVDGAAPWSSTLGYYHLMAQEPEKAVVAYQSAVNNDPLNEDARLGLADAFVALKRFDEAARLTSGLLGAHAKEPTYLNRHAWVRFNQGRYEEAKALYERSLQSDATNLDAKLGRAWCMLYTGERERAHRDFGEVLRRAQGNASAIKGLRASEPAPTIFPSSFLSVTGGDSDAPSTWSVGAIVGLDTFLFERILFGARYRLLHLWGTDDTDRGAVDGERVDVLQHGGYVDLGYVAPSGRWTVIARGGGVTYSQSSIAEDTTRSDSSAGVLGASASLRAWANWSVEGYRAFFYDFDVTQLAASAELPLLSWLRLDLGGGTDSSDDGRVYHGRAGLLLYSQDASLGVSGVLGERTRPFDVSSHALYNLSALMEQQLRVELTYRLSPVVTLYGAFETERFHSTGDDKDADVTNDSSSSDYRYRLYRGTFGARFDF